MHPSTKRTLLTKVERKNTAIAVKTCINSGTGGFFEIKLPVVVSAKLKVEIDNAANKS